MTTKYLSVRDVAARLNVSVPTVWRWSRTTDFPKPAHFGRLARWSVEAIEQWERAKEEAA